MRNIGVVGLFLMLATSSALAELKLDIRGSRVVGTGLTPGGRAVWFGVERSQVDWYPHVEVVVQVSADRSGAGELNLVREEMVSPRSVWFLVDAVTGDLVGLAPEGRVYREGSTPSVELARGAECTQLVIPSHDIVEVLLVRPSGLSGGPLGAWHVQVGDGAPADRDNLANGVILLCLSDLVPLEGAGPAPTFVLGGDTVVVVDTETFECRATRVDSGSEIL